MSAEMACDVCGRPLRSDNRSGVCSGSAECKREVKRRERAAKPELHRERRRAYYAANPQAARERARAWEKANPEAYAARKRAWRQANPGYKGSREVQRRRRAENPEGPRAATRRWRAANREAARETTRIYRQRADRPCRYAKAGCTEFSAVGKLACLQHSRADGRRYFQRKRDNLRGDLAAAQGFICPWCALPLAPDCAATEIDHTIPVSRGGPNEDWNLQLLHGMCNQAKNDKVTSAALELAAAHGLILDHAMHAFRRQDALFGLEAT